MTTAIKIHPQELLSQLENSKSSGCLELDEGLVSWKIYLQQGNLKYVYCSAQLLDQLKYYLHYLGWKQALAALKSPSYVKIQSHLQKGSSDHNLYSNIISWLLTEKHLNLFQGSKVIEYMTKDALQSCLWLNKGTFSWHSREPIPVWIQEHFGNSISLNISECLNVEQKRLKKWQNCSEQLLTVHQRPYFASGWKQKVFPTSGLLNYANLNKLTKVIRGQTSIRQLSLLLQKDEFHIVEILSPYIDHEIIYLRNPQPPLDLLPNIPRLKTIVRYSPHLELFTNSKKTKFAISNTGIKTWKIVCIDDSPTILKEIKRFLDREKFEVTALTDPVQAVPIVFRLEPDLILLDITMPKINGYKLCGLLRGSERCVRTPIIMVTGNTGLIDKARAKIAGATDYFTKPFTREGLRKIVEKYLN